MDISACLTKLGYQALVWDNKYEGIRLHELEEKPMPTLEELEKVWLEIQPDIEIEKKIQAKMVELKEQQVVDLKQQAVDSLKADMIIPFEYEIRNIKGV